VANLAQVDVALEHALIIAPFDGVISVRHREPGEVVGAGAVVLTLQDPNDRWVRIFVPENRVGRLQLGQSAVISADAYPDERYRGEITFIADEAEFTPRNVQTTEERVKLVFRVKVRVVEDRYGTLKPGLPADVLLDTPSRE
jgi:HlyD family secretion protein